MITNKFSKIRVGLLLNLVVGVLFVIAAGVIILLVNYEARQQALVEAKSKARILLDHNLATHTYFSHNLKPALFEWTDPFRSADYFDPTWMSSTYAVREIDQYFKSMSPAEYYYKEGAINARSPKNEANPYEQEFIERLNSDPNLVETSDIRYLDGQPYFVTMRRGEAMEESCLRCHSTPEVAPGGLVERYGPERSFHRYEGEVVSAISIRVPLAEAYAEADRMSWRLSGLLLLLLVGLFGTQYWVSERLVLKPVAVIRDKARQILASRKHLGEAIRLPPLAGKELHELGAAFSAMSSDLRDSQEQLEARVRSRTTDLRQANTRLQQEIAERQRMEERLKVYSEQLEVMVEARTQELRQMQAQLLRREKLAVLGQLSGGLAHQLRTPLANIKNASYLLNLTTNKTEPAAQQALAVLEAEVNRAERVTSSLLDFARTRAPHRCRVELETLLRDVVAQVSPPDDPPIEVVIESAGDLPPVLADPDQLSQVFDNLIVNAVQAMPTGGRLKITADLIEPNWIAVSVADSGVGIPSKDLGKIFEPLVTTKPKGIGLGLVLIQNLVEANGGRIEVESEVGQGSTFTVWLPLTDSSRPSGGSSGY